MARDSTAVTADRLPSEPKAVRHDADSVELAGHSGRPARHRPYFHGSRTSCEFPDSPHLRNIGCRSHCHDSSTVRGSPDPDPGSRRSTAGRTDARRGRALCHGPTRRIGGLPHTPPPIDRRAEACLTPVGDRSPVVDAAGQPGTAGAPQRASPVTLRGLTCPRHPTGDRLHVEELLFHIAASIGIATFPTDGDRPDELITCTDLAMCAAKNGGGDRCLQFSRSSARRPWIQHSRGTVWHMRSSRPPSPRQRGSHDHEQPTAAPTPLRSHCQRCFDFLPAHALSTCATADGPAPRSPV